MTTESRAVSRTAIARASGIVLIALGFVVGMQGLDEPRSIWPATALGLLTAGMVAQGYALYRGIRHGHDRQAPTQHGEDP